MTFRKLAPEKRQKLGEQWRIFLISAPECVRRDLVFPGRPAQTQVDPAGVRDGGTVKKSTETICERWFSRKVRQV
jgi:hypothetical protein